MTNKFGFALIGCGRIGERHAEHISKLGRLTAVLDINEERAKKIALKYNVPYFTDIDNFFSNIAKTDVISICTPNGTHAELTINSFANGFHVLCEKPMAISVSDCGKMIMAAEKYNKRLFVVKQNRFNPPVKALKKAIDENKLGKILSVQLNCFWNRNANYYSESDWKGSANLDGGILYTQFSHFIDLLFWMIGDVEKVYALTDNFMHSDSIDFEDTGVVILKFNNNAIGTINFTINAHKKNMEGSLIVFGERGTVKIGGQYLNELEYQQIEGYEISNLEKGNKPNNYGEYQGSMSNHDKVYENILDVLGSNGAIATNGFEGLKTVEIIEKIYSAAKDARK